MSKLIDLIDKAKEQIRKLNGELENLEALEAAAYAGKVQIRLTNYSGWLDCPTGEIPTFYGPIENYRVRPAVREFYVHLHDDGRKVVWPTPCDSCILVREVVKE